MTLMMKIRVRWIGLLLAAVHGVYGLPVMGGPAQPEKKGTPSWGAWLYDRTLGTIKGATDMVSAVVGGWGGEEEDGQELEGGQAQHGITEEGREEILQRAEVEAGRAVARVTGKQRRDIRKGDLTKEQLRAPYIEEFLSEEQEKYANMAFDTFDGVMGQEVRDVFAKKMDAVYREALEEKNRESDIMKGRVERSGGVNEMEEGISSISSVMRGVVTLVVALVVGVLIDRVLLPLLILMAKVFWKAWRGIGRLVHRKVRGWTWRRKEVPTFRRSLVHGAGNNKVAA